MPAAGFARTCRQAFTQWHHARRRVLDRGATPGAVHDLRLCMRRLMALEALLAPRGRHELTEALDAVFHASGKLRDAQLDARALRKLASTLPAATTLARHEATRLPRLQRRLQRELRHVQGSRLRREAAQWLDAREARNVDHAPGALRRLASAQRSISNSRPWPTARRALHHRRLRLKQCRYMAELLRDAHGTLPRGMSLARLASLQRRLGVVTDLDVQLHAVARFGAHHPGWKDDARALRASLRHQRTLALRTVADRQVPRSGAS
jgi:CHAD domain-containing protein